MTSFFDRAFGKLEMDDWVSRREYAVDAKNDSNCIVAEEVPIQNGERTIMKYCVMPHDVLRPSLTPATETFLYEVITCPCAFFMDLDYTYEGMPCFEKCDNAFNWFLSALELPGPVFIKDASYIKKFSRHVIAPNLTFASPPDVAVWLCGQWAKQLRGRLDESMAITDKMIDWSVYQTNHLLRLLGNSKRSDPTRPLRMLSHSDQPTTFDPLRTLVSLHRRVLDTDYRSPKSPLWKSSPEFLAMEKRRVGFCLKPLISRSAMGFGRFLKRKNMQPINPTVCKSGRIFTTAKAVFFKEIYNAAVGGPLGIYFKTWRPTLTEIRVDKLFIAFNLQTKQCPIKRLARNENRGAHRSAHGRMVIYNWRNSIHVQV